MNQFLQGFSPHPVIKGAIIQTIIGSQFSGEGLKLSDKISHYIDLDVNAKTVLYEIETEGKDKPVVMLAHGMGGCSESGYIKRIASKLSAQGYGTFMINHRGSGHGMGLSPTLWNGGSSDDLDTIVRFILDKHPSLLLIGFSLSGNILLKYLGEGGDIPSGLVGALAVNPPIDLRIASHILSTHPSCWLFNRYYMKLIGNQAQALVKNFPDALDPRKNLKTIWEFDASYTAPAGGFKDLDEYYDQCSSKNYLKKIEIPTTVLCSMDDPFVPPKVFKDIPGNVDFYQPREGGHMGYISKQKTRYGDRRWMDYMVIEWVNEMSKKANPFLKKKGL